MINRRILGLLIASVATAASLSAQSVRVADSLLRRGELQRAESMYYAATRARPRDPEARFALGKYLLDRGAFRIGATLIDEAMQFGYDRRAGSALLARVYINLGEYAAAEGLPVNSPSSGEHAQIRWLAAHPKRVLASDSSALVAFSRTSVPGYLGAIRIRLNGQPMIAMVSPRTTCALRVSDTAAVARTLHRFGASPRAGEGLSAAADSLVLNRWMIHNVPAVIEPMRENVQAVVCFGLLANYAPFFEPLANLMTLHLGGVVGAPSSRSVVTPILDVEGQYTMFTSNGWTPLASPAAMQVLGTRRWTFDSRRGQITIDGPGRD